MAKAPKTTSGNTTPKTEYIPEGKHYAVVSSVIDLGTHHIKSQEYGDRDVRQLYIMRELPEVKHVFSEEKGAQSVVIGQTYTFSMGKKAKLRNVSESIIGKPFKDDDTAFDYDVSELIGKACKLNLVHNGDYVNIFSIIDCDRDDKIKETLNKVSFFLESFDKDLFATLPEWLQEKIRTSPEYQEVAKNPPENTLPLGDDDLPF